MKLHIITSSYPATPQDPSGTAGLFVRQFALELAAMDHTVIVQPAARKQHYVADPGITIAPAPWKGGDQELASMDLLRPVNWLIFLHFFICGANNTITINEKYSIERTLCMWAVPSGIFGLAGKIKKKIPYDVWVLGSDIWKIRKIPYLGPMILRKIMMGADRVFADGQQLCHDVTDLTGVPCKFLATSRKLPPPLKKVKLSHNPAIKHFLFVGRFHVNKGPDLLIRAVACLPPEIREAIRVHLFGLGPMELELKKIVTDLQLGHSVQINGPIQAQDLANYLDSVSFLVIPSRIESIPLVFSDALQRGTPVVAMPVGDLEKMIKLYKCGIVAEKVSAAALAAAIKKAACLEKDVFAESIARAYAQLEITGTVAKWMDFNTMSSGAEKFP